MSNIEGNRETKAIELIFGNRGTKRFMSGQERDNIGTPARRPHLSNDAFWEVYI